ncbi:hypothetical protein EJD97_017470 [Solanum chilense]|uniref:CCHC-type domain-containing protein n=1 Tax=Solanum chilense TaxID=4083 RepID=A0A6N2B5F9_SOLCI|nr:hypothetical protein EJD97_017470 [Solanum chilense]
MSRFVTVVSDDLQEECHSSMLHDNMNISRLMVHTKYMQEERSRRKSRDAKRARSFAGGRSGNSPLEKPTCTMCGKCHFGECLVGTGNYFGCGKSGHKVRDCPSIKGLEKGGQDYASGSNEAPKKNRFYALRSRGEKETSPDVVAEWKEGNYIPKGLISCLKACKIISKGCLYNNVRVHDLGSKIQPIESVHVVREILEVFPNDLPGILPKQEIDFGIDLLPDINLI